MKRRAGNRAGSRTMRIVLALTVFVILLPVIVTMIWTVTGRWPWPSMLPQSYTMRTLQELFSGSSPLYEILWGSVIIATVVAILGTLIALMTARATEIYRIRGRRLVSWAAMLPLIVPGTVFAMGIQVILIRMGLGDTVTGVILVHLVAALPYCVFIMTDITAAVGNSLEEQAQLLGAGPGRAFFDVSVPQLMPGILSSASMAYIISYSQYFTTLLAGGGKVKTLALVMVPYIQSGDRALSSVYAVTFVGSALLVFFIFEALIHRIMRTES
ncbi:MAG: ABC transporter permease subunit [Mogibacterium sp.]|nr:ABC transporter permease subunit [Mogibacterium sp.]